MIGIILILLAAAACAVVLTLVSETFAGGVSRVAEAAFDSVEYRLALRERRLEARASERRTREQRACGAAYATNGAGLSW